VIYNSSNFAQAILRNFAFNHNWNFANFAYHANVKIIRPSNATKDAHSKKEKEQ